MDKDKGQKIIAAVYLATNHLSDSDPLKRNLREKSMQLVDPGKQSLAAQAVDMLLGAAVLAKVISDKNASIISFEMYRFVSPSGVHSEEQISNMFLQSGSSLPKSDRPSGALSYRTTRPLNEISKISSPRETVESKNRRHDAILSFINTRKSAAIKDIASLFPELSEKTIQRELGALVSSGKITKRGSKRWSIYMAVGA